MDTSEKYITMCEKATQIQELADEHLDEFSISCWYAPNHVKCKGHFEDWHMKYKFCPVCAKPLIITPEYSFSRRMKRDGTLWLPKQEQLQEICGKWINEQLGYGSDRGGLISAFIGFKHWLDQQYYDEKWVCVPTNVFDSGEQLWLAYAMKEIYNKIWIEEDWKNDN